MDCGEYQSSAPRMSSFNPASRLEECGDALYYYHRHLQIENHYAAEQDCSLVRPTRCLCCLRQITNISMVKSQECRNRHVKCVYLSLPSTTILFTSSRLTRKTPGDGQKPSCKRCEKTGLSCIWQDLSSGFRHGSSASARYSFADDQPWLPIGQVDYNYVDETADIAKHYSLDSNCDSSWALPRRQSIGSPDNQAVEKPSLLNENTTSHSSEPFLSPSSHRREGADTLAVFSPCQPLQSSPENHSSIPSASPNFSHSSNASPGCQDFINPGDTRLPSLNEHEACLLRYFVVQLAPWFDLCDGERHFACTVPLRARSCPPLLNAIYTASARHLSRIKKYYHGNQIHYGGKVLPDLTPETAIHYHNECIAHLVSLSDHSREAQDENLLAAAVILRFYEEVDNEDTESALKGIQIFLDVQAPSAVAGFGLRHAAYWIALRQEIITAFSKQRPFRLPLDPCEPYRSFEPADDYVWADRLVIHCADVLQYCFGSDEEGVPRDSHQSSSTGILHPIPATDMRIARYNELILFETLWTELGPPSFKPIYTREPDRTRGEVFPELWYLNNCHVAGLQFFELARILLIVYNPKLPRLGPSQRTAMRSVDQKVRSIVLRLCGMALSNQHSPPGFVTASVAVGMCGDRFTDRLEQEALLEFLTKLGEEHAYPVFSTQKSLKGAWGWDGYDGME